MATVLCSAAAADAAHGAHHRCLCQRPQPALPLALPLPLHACGCGLKLARRYGLEMACGMACGMDWACGVEDCTCSGPNFARYCGLKIARHCGLSVQS